MQNLANSIYPGMIEMTVDYPSNYTDNKMPMLDLKVWTNEEGIILHEFYIKPVSY